MRLVCRFFGHKPVWTLHPLYGPTVPSGPCIVVCWRCGKSRYGRMSQVSPL